MRELSCTCVFDILFHHIYTCFKSGGKNTREKCRKISVFEHKHPELYHEKEDIAHFCLHCPLYFTQRTKLLRSICVILPPNVQIETGRFLNQLHEHQCAP